MVTIFDQFGQQLDSRWNNALLRVADVNGGFVDEAAVIDGEAEEEPEYRFGPLIPANATLIENGQIPAFIDALDDLQYTYVPLDADKPIFILAPAIKRQTSIRSVNGKNVCVWKDNFLPVA